jgi:hypothetical protein
VVVVAAVVVYVRYCTTPHTLHEGMTKLQGTREQGNKETRDKQREKEESAGRKSMKGDREERTSETEEEEEEEEIAIFLFPMQKQRYGRLRLCLLLLLYIPPSLPP